MSTSEQYHSIRYSITANLTTIKALLSQADRLHQIVAELDNNVDEAEKKKLNTSIEGIYSSIDALVAQTDELFRMFVTYAKAQEKINTES